MVRPMRESTSCIGSLGRASLISGAPMRQPKRGGFRADRETVGAGIIARMGFTRVVSRVALPFLGLILPFFSEAQTATSWSGALRDAAGRPVSGARLELLAGSRAEAEYHSISAADGSFLFPAIRPGDYGLVVNANGRIWNAAGPVEVREGAALAAGVVLGADGAAVVESWKGAAPAGSAIHGSGGERLSSEEVSSLPLNERDFSKLLLLAAGTMTDSNGAANFTQQFSVNG